MNFNQLENFIVLYQTQSITKASESLFMTRQALSLSLKSMEDELGVPLFIRVSNGLEPTREGEILYLYARDTIKAKEDVLFRIKSTRKNAALSLAFHVIFYSREQLRSIKEVCQRLTGFNPKIINISTSKEGLDLIQQGKADLAATYTPQSQKGVQCISVISPCDFLLVMNRNDPLTQKESVDFMSDLKEREIVFLSSGIMNRTRDDLRAQNATPIFLTPDRALLHESLETDNSVMIIQSQSRSVFLSENTTVRRLRNFPMDLGFFLLIREDSRSDALSQLIEFLTGEFQEKREAENQEADRLYHTGLS